MKQETVIKCWKIAAGSAAAIFISEWLGLDYAASAGIITLLTIQNTRRATIQLSVYRLLSFFVAMLLSGIMSGLFGFHAFGYGSFMILLTIISYSFQWGDTISTNAVFGTHLFMAEEFMTQAFIWNEFCLLVIGTSIALLLNWKMPNCEKEVRYFLEYTEQEMRDIMSDISEQLLSQDGAVQQRILRLSKMLTEAQEKSVENMENTLQEHSEFYINYFEMRQQQCTLLMHFCQSALSLRIVPDQAERIAQFVSVVSENFGLEVDTTPRIQLMKDLLVFFETQPLPVSRDEFEARALLFYGLKELEEFLKLKQTFTEQLTQEQKRLYLNIQSQTLPSKNNEKIGAI